MCVSVQKPLQGRLINKSDSTTQTADGSILASTYVYTHEGTFLIKMGLNLANVL